MQIKQLHWLRSPRSRPSFLLDIPVSSFVAIECDSAADVFFLWMTIDDKRLNLLKGKYISVEQNTFD